MEPLPSNASRATHKTAPVGASDNIRLEPGANRQLTAQAKKLKMSKSKYASAAIAYFAERGLNPTVELPQNLADVRKVVIQEARTTRVQQVEIGNRMIAINKTWEKALYEFLKMLQGGTLNYLEQIESDILRHQVAIETNYLSPMVEMLLTAKAEAYLARVIGERTNLRVRGKEDSEWAAATKAINDERDQKVMGQVREFIKTNSVPAPKLASKPQLPAVPVRVPTAVPAAAPAAVPAAGTPPK